MKQLINIILLSVSTLAYGNTERNIDDIIMKLEEKLLQHQKEESLQDKRWNIPVTKKTDKTYVFKQKEIVGMTKSQKKIDSLERDISIIGNNLQGISDDIEKLKELIRYGERTDPDLKVTISLQNPNNSSLRNVTVYIDGHTVFESDFSPIPFRPIEPVPIFDGIVESGTHIVKIIGKITKSISSNIAIENNIVLPFEREYKVNIKDENKKININISSRSQTSNNFQVKLIEL